jgi:hypothetical protein
MINLMFNILSPLAKLLIQQELTGDKDSDVAAPCFGYYPLGDDGKPLPPLKPNDLYNAALTWATKALDIAPSKGDKDTLTGVVAQIQQSPPE